MQARATPSLTADPPTTRSSSPTRHQGGLGPGFEAMLHRIDDRLAVEARRGIRAWLLAPTLELYQALMRGEEVPLERLNPEAVARYGLRQRGGV